MLALVLAALTFALPQDAPSPRPLNIVFILADDLGWTDVGCMGSRYYETPHIDALAADGIRFLQHHHCQNCAPTRGALMTGQSPARTGIYTVGSLARGAAARRTMNVPENRTRLPDGVLTMADQLTAAGYVTALFGKWHLGNGPLHHPRRHGFAEAIVSEGKHFGFATTPKVEVPEGAYLADFLTDLAVDFLERQRDRPFFLYLPHFGVHSPYQAKPDLIARFADKAGVGGHSDPTYAAMIASVDDSVGRVLATLKRLGLHERTVVVFASDNGGVGGYAGIGGKGVTDNAPLRGGKGMLYEGGVRVPMIVRWPGVTPRGSTCAVPTQHVDVLPTLLGIAGAKLPDQPLDGESLVPLLRDAGATLVRDALYVHFPGYLEGYRTQQWRTAPVGTIQVGMLKLLEFFEDGRTELYDLANDPSEAHDLAATRPEDVKTLHARLTAWRKDLGVAMPVRK